MQNPFERFVHSSLPLSSALLLTSGLTAQLTWSPISVGTPPARSAAGAAAPNGQLTLVLPASPSLFGTHLYVQGIAFLTVLAPTGWNVTTPYDLQLGWL